MTEFSVIWLLLLGVVLVLLSSGVLVASQWARFPAWGQYSVLWAYTVMFGVSALGAQSHPRLQLTGRALQMVTLLLVPLNSLAMDSFALARSAIGIAVVGLAVFSLSGLTIKLYRGLPGASTHSSVKHSWLSYGLLSLVHGGWGLPFVPALAVYTGVVSAAVSPAGISRGFTLTFPGLLQAYGLGLLLVRALYYLPVSQLGLAIALWGFLVAWPHRATGSVRVPTQGKHAASTVSVSAVSASGMSTTRAQPASLVPSELLGWGCVLLGWGVAFGVVPWQALGASVLAALLLANRLRQTWSRADLTLLLVVGLQMVWLLWDMVPEPGQAVAQSISDRLIGSQGRPWAALSLVFFPYLTGMVVFSEWLGHRRQHSLAQFNDWLAVGLGGTLLLLGSLNPTLQILSLAATTGLTGGVVQRRWRRLPARENLPAPKAAEQPLEQSARISPDQSIQLLGVLTHVGGWLALVAAIARFFPMLTSVQWSWVSLGMMAAEALFSLGPTPTNETTIATPSGHRTLTRLLRQSAWPLCLLAAALTYLGIFATWTLAGQGLGVFSPRSGVVSLAVPAMLTLMAGLRPERRRLAAGLSGVFLVLSVPLIWASGPTRLLGLGIATGLMGLNTRYRQTQLMAWTSVGFGLIFLEMLVYQGFQIPLLDLIDDNWPLHWAIAPWLLWGGHRWLRHQRSRLALLYRRAVDYWAFTLVSLMLIAGILWAGLHGVYGHSIAGQFVMFALVLMAAPTYRSSYQSTRPRAHGDAVEDSDALEPGQAVRPYRCGTGEACYLFSIMVILVGQLMTGWQLPGQMMGLVLGIGLLFLHSRWWRQLPVALLTVGMALALEISVLHHLPVQPVQPLPAIALATLTTLALWGLRQGLQLGVKTSRGTIACQAAPHDADAMAGRETPTAVRFYRFWINGHESVRAPGSMPRLYAEALDVWAFALGLGVLVYLTHYAVFAIGITQPAPAEITLSAALMMGALLFRNGRHLSNWGLCSIGWSLELWVTASLSHVSQSLVVLAVANVLLGIGTQLLGNWLHRSQQTPMLMSWHILPLVYGALGAALRTGFFTSWTGFSTLGLVMIALGIGRRKSEFKPLIYLALAGVSVTAFELVFYQIRPLAVGDQCAALAATAATLVYAYRILKPWLTDYLQLPPSQLIAIAHGHWAVGSGLLLGTLGFPLIQNMWLGLGTGVFLVRYALRQGRYQDESVRLPSPDDRLAEPAPLATARTAQIEAEVWVYLGILEAGGLALYGATVFIAPLILLALLPWLAAIATALAGLLYSAPWQRWGWPPRPWRVMASLLPIVSVAGSYGKISPVSLLVVAGFYGVIAWQRQQPRGYYLSIGCVDWAILIGLFRLDWVAPFPLACVAGLSVLGITWIDPDLQQPAGHQLRHALRGVGAGIICLVPLLTDQTHGLLPAGVSLVIVLLSLVLRIRAFLYVGTVVFLLNASYQLLILSVTYPLMKWVIGLVAGLSLIVLAANFETRRTQVGQLLSRWADGLRDWE